MEKHKKTAQESQGKSYYTFTRDQSLRVLARKHKTIRSLGRPQELPYDV